MWTREPSKVSESFLWRCLKTKFPEAPELSRGRERRPGLIYKGIEQDPFVEAGRLLEVLVTNREETALTELVHRGPDFAKWVA